MKLSKSKNPQAGFTMIEMILTLLVLSLCTVLFSRIAYLLANIETSDHRSEDEIAILQLQLMFAQGSSYQLSGNGCSMRYHGEDIYFEWNDHRLVKRPGFEVILQNVDETSFVQEDSCVSLTWRRGETYEKNVLGCE